MTTIISISKVREYYIQNNKLPKGWVWDRGFDKYSLYKAKSYAVSRIKELKAEGYKCFIIEEKAEAPFWLSKTYDNYNYRVIRTRGKISK